MPLPRWFAERVEPTAPDAELRVSTIELFFDLVFVFTITQLTSLLVDDFTRQDGEGFTGQGTVQAVLIFGLLWWMYSGYAWLTNTVPPEHAARRVLILGGMAGFLIMALAIPRAFRAAAWRSPSAISSSCSSTAGSISRRRPPSPGSCRST